MFRLFHRLFLAVSMVLLLAVYGCGGSSSQPSTDGMTGDGMTGDGMTGDGMTGDGDDMPSFGMPGFIDPRIEADDWRHAAASYARLVVGGQEPTLSSSGHDAKARQLAAGTDVISILSFWNPGDGWGQSDPNCSGTTCDWNDPDNPPLTRETYVPPYENITIYPVMNRNGIELHVAVYQGANSLGPWEGETFAAVLDHVLIGTSFQEWDSGELSSARFAWGSSTGSNPVSGTASWSGVMIGDASTATDGRWMQGDTEITMHFGPSPTLDVEFSNIKGFADPGEPAIDYAIDPWMSVPVSDGSFQDGNYFGDDGDRYLEGHFFGPDGEEVAGVFYDWLSSDPNVYFEGAFGADRDQQ